MTNLCGLMTEFSSDLLSRAGFCGGQSFPLACNLGCCADALQPLNVLTGPPAILTIVKQPSGTQQGGIVFDVMPVIQVKDAGQNNYTDDQGMSIVASLSATAQPELLDPKTLAVLAGTTTVNTQRGLARFTDLSIGAAGNRFVISFRVLRTSSLDVITAHASPFNVIVGPAVALDFRRQPSTSASGVALLGNPQIVLVDQGGNAVTGGTPTISAWLVTDLAECAAVPPTLVGDVQQKGSGAVAEISTTSVAYPCASVRMRATVSSRSFITDSAVFSSDFGPPVNFELEYVTHDSVALLWRSPVTGAAPAAFFLEYGPRPGYRAPGEQDVLVRLAGTSTETLVSGLSANKAYFFKICSISKYSASKATAGLTSVFVEKCATGSPVELVAAPVQKPEYFEVHFVGRTFVDLKWWSPTLGPNPPGYKVTVTCNNATSCSPQEYGFEYPAYALVDGKKYLQIDAPAASHSGGTVLFRVTNLTATKGYIFKVVSRAAVLDTVFDQTLLYAPKGPSLESIYPMATLDRNSISVACSEVPCTGSTIEVQWLSAQEPGVLPDAYKLTVSQYDWATGRPSGTYTAAEIAHGKGGAKSLIIPSLIKGQLIQVRLYSHSSQARDYWGPAAEFVFRPISRPSPPTALNIDVVRNEELRVSWQPPRDSGNSNVCVGVLSSFSVSPP